MARSFSAGSETVSDVSFFGVQKAIEDKLRTAIEQLTADLLARAQANARATFDTHTGLLVGSLKSKTWEKPGVRIGGLVKAGAGRGFYATFFELGFNRRTKAGDVKDHRPFLRPAMDDMRSTIRERLRAVAQAAARSA